jgi:hypothetical protein
MLFKITNQRTTRQEDFELERQLEGGEEGWLNGRRFLEPLLKQTMQTSTCEEIRYLELAESATLPYGYKKRTGETRGERMESYFTYNGNRDP